MDGLHVIANLNHCRGGTRHLADADTLRRFCIDSISRSGLTVVGELFHQFEGGGVTGALVLAESHLAIHTWPELKSVTVDIYVCNYTQDNGAKARRVVDDLIELFRPADCVRHDVSRGTCTREQGSAHALANSTSAAGGE